MGIYGYTVRGTPNCPLNVSLSFCDHGFRSLSEVFFQGMEEKNMVAFMNPLDSKINRCTFLYIYIYKYTPDI